MRVKVIMASVFLFTLTMAGCATATSINNSVETSSDVSIIELQSGNASVVTSSNSSVISSVVNSGPMISNVTSYVSVITTGWTIDEQNDMIQYVGEVIPYLSEFSGGYFFEIRNDNDGVGEYVYIEINGDYLSAYMQAVSASGFSLDEQGTQEDDEFNYVWFSKVKDSKSDYYIDIFHYPSLNLFIIVFYLYVG